MKRIILAVDHTEADEFAEYLNEQGHDAQVGNSTGSYVDGSQTDHDQDANDWLNGQWDAYCNA